MFYPFGGLLLSLEDFFVLEEMLGVVVATLLAGKFTTVEL